jgi:hypothetical protein
MGALGGFLVVCAAMRFCALGAVLVLFGFLWRVIMGSDPFVVSLGPIEIYMQDLLCMSLFAVAMLRLGWRNLRIPRLLYAALAFQLLLVAASFIRGAAVFGVERAGLEVREMYGFWGVTLYFASFNLTPRRLAVVTKLCIGAAVVVAVVAMVRLATGAVVGSTADEYEGMMRVVTASDALWMAQAAIAVLYLAREPKSPTWMSFLSMGLFFMTLAMRHRTDMIVVLAAMLCMLVIERRNLKRAANIVYATAMLTVVLIVATYLGLSQSLGTEAVKNVGDQVANSGTAEWRLEGWIALVEKQLRSPVETAIGVPFGGGYEREMKSNDGAVLSGAPHNFYVSTFVRTGILGLLAFVCMYGLLLGHYWRRVRLRAAGVFGTTVFIPILLTHLLYYITYGAPVEQGLLLGSILAFTASKGPRRATMPPGVDRR